MGLEITIDMLSSASRLLVWLLLYVCELDLRENVNVFHTRNRWAVVAVRRSTVGAGFIYAQ